VSSDPHEIKALFEAAREETRAALEAILAELPPARAAYAAAKQRELIEGRRLNAIAGRVIVGVRYSGGAAPALAKIEMEAREQVRQAEIEAERCRRRVADLEWRVGSLQDDLQQIERAIAPPEFDRDRRPEIVKRPPPPGPKEVELVEFPGGVAHTHPSG
jgi:chromosome segregation ATPase